MFEVITLGLMLHSHHFDSLDIGVTNPEEVQSIHKCYKESRCGQKPVDSGEPFRYQNNNVGIYAIVDGWTASVFRNSYGKPSVFGGYTFEKETKYGILGATAGLSTGYQYRNHSWVRDGITYNYRSGLTGAVLIPTAMVSYATPKLFNTDARMRLMYTPKKNVLTVGIEKQF